MVEYIYNIFLQTPVINTDSRTIQPGQIYFALKGERFDGNDFVNQAIDNGASHVVTSNLKFIGDKNITIVENPLASLQDLAFFHRKQLGIPIIAITGSNGKTTTKELLATCLASAYKINYTQGNLNNHIGVPLTLLSFNDNTEIGIVEMGANHIGEIAKLCQIAAPDYGVITNIGPAHLEGFGSLDGVYKAKTELYEYLNENNGKIFFNANEESLQRLSNQYANMLRYDCQFFWQESQHFVSEISADPVLTFDADNLIYQTQLAGSYNFNNILTAIAISNYFNVSIVDAATAITTYIPSNNRSQRKSFKGINVILDAYNANPGSVRSALENITRMTASQKSLILGDMKELGKYSIDLHREILNTITSLNIFTHVILIGSEYYQLKDEFAQYKFYQLLTDYKPDWEMFKGHLLLAKGSRSISLEKLFHDIDSMP